MRDIGAAFEMAEYPEPPAVIEAVIERPLNDAKSFIMAGRAIFTLVGRESRYTYKITRVEPAEGSQYTQATYFVYILIGPDNTSEYMYLGLLDATSGLVRLTRKSSYKEDSRPVLALRWALPILWQGRELPAPAKILHAGRCGRCGRLLTVPESIESGFGPECAGRT